MAGPNVDRNLVVWVSVISAAPTARAGTAVSAVYAQRSVRVSYNLGDGQPFFFAEPRLADVPEFVQTAAAQGKFEGFEVPSYGSLRIHNLDGALDAWDTYLWRSAVVRIYDLAGTDDEIDLASATPALVCAVADCLPGRRSVELALRDLRWNFTADNLLTVPYRGHQHAARFNGSSMYGASGNVSSTTDLTWEAWVAVHGTPSGTCEILAHSSAFAAGTTDVAVEMTTSKTIRAVCYNSGGGTVATSYVAAPGRTGDWFHLAVAVSMSGGTMTVSLYFDGALAATNSGAVTRTTAALPVYVAAAPGPLGYAPVSLSDLRLWNVAKSASEIRAAMRSRLKGDEAGLVQLWRIDDGAGTTCPSSVTGGGAGAIALTGTPVWISAAEGTADLAGQLQPRAFGLVENIRCQGVDPLRLVYRIAQGPLGDLGGGLAIRDTGSPYTLDTGGDFDNLDSFVQATVASGKFVTCLRHGLVKLGTAPTGELTADTLGEQWDATVHAPRYAVRLNGSSQYGSATVGWAAGSWSAGAWVCLRATPNAGARIFHNEAAGNTATRILRFPTSPATYPVAICRNDAGTAFIAQSTTALLALHRWYHVMAAHDVAAQVLRLYVNGVVVAETATSGAFTLTPGTTAYVGSNAGTGNYLQADVARVFAGDGAAALTPAAVTLFQNPFGTYPGYLWMGTDGAGTTLTDHGSLASHMSLTGTPSWAPGPAPDFAAPWLERFVPLAVYQPPADFVVTIPTDRQSFLDLPPYSLGFVATEAGAAVSDLLDAVLLSVGAALPTPDEAIRFARPGYAWSPGLSTEAAEAAALAPGSWEVDSFEPAKTAEPTHTVALGYRPVWFAQPGDGLFSTVSTANRDLWSQEIRIHEETDGRLLGILSGQVPKLEVNTLLTRREDAIAEARRRLSLYSRSRRYSTLVLKGLSPAPGDGVDLSGYSTRFSLASEPIVRVVSVNTRKRGGRATCTVFRA